jgi:hypothetical protein
MKRANGRADVFTLCILCRQRIRQPNDTWSRPMGAGLSPQSVCEQLHHCLRDYNLGRTVRNNRERSNQTRRKRKVILRQEVEGRMKWICVVPQSLLQNGNKTLSTETKNKDRVTEFVLGGPSVAVALFPGRKVV